MTVLVTLATEAVNGMVTYGDFAKAIAAVCTVFGGAIGVLWRDYAANKKKCFDDREADKDEREEERRRYEDEIKALHKQLLESSTSMIKALLERSEAEDEIRLSMVETVSDSRKATERNIETMQSLVNGIVRFESETIRAINELKPQRAQVQVLGEPR